ncbi:unnamed protein product, partial [Mesorhabditis belari]|uniref:Mitochondrial proton/calcium exchanger protein n=1 Tax=Mesorhabditis belari TaxID=2138241 RepID=A0AAF3EX01_9BILA
MYRQCKSTFRLARHAYKGLSGTARYHLNNPIALHRAQIHLASVRYAATDRSKVEETLKMLKEDLERQQAEETQRLKLVPAASGEVQKLTIGQKIMHELKHYYHGFRLLALETRLGAKYLFRIVRGSSLTRKERQQLVRTVSDLFRLVPFSIFIIVPFMELALPFFIKFFPNMLPSTFQEKSKEEEKIAKQLKVRVEMAKFLQDTIEEIALEKKSRSKEVKPTESKALEFAQFIKKVRTEGGYVSNADLFKYTKLFEDELTLDNLSMSQLRALCKLLSIQPLGTPEILRFQLNLKLRELKADDKQIAAEGGVDALPIPELQIACRARGMRSVGVSEDRLKEQMRQWLELSLNDKVPPSLLLLSRTMYLPEDFSFTDRLKNIMKNLPDGIAEQTRQKLTEMEGGKIDHKARIALIKAIEEGIKKEKDLAVKQQQEKQKEVAAKAELEAEKAKNIQDLADEMKTQSILGEAIAEAAKAAHQSVEEVKSTLAHLSKDAAAQATKPTKEAIKEEIKVDPKELASIENILHGGALHEAKHDIIGLKEKVIEHSEDLLEISSLDGQFAESKVAARLRNRLNSMIENVDHLVTKLEDDKKNIDETIADPAVPEAAVEKKERLVRITDLVDSLKKLKTITDEKKQARIEELLNAVDEDKDGVIDSALVLEVIELMEKHSDVPMSASQITAMIEMLKKEDQAEAVAEAMKQINIGEPILPRGSTCEDELSALNDGPLDVTDAVPVPKTAQLNKENSPKKTSQL